MGGGVGSLWEIGELGVVLFGRRVSAQSGHCGIVRHCIAVSPKLSLMYHSSSAAAASARSSPSSSHQGSIFPSSSEKG